MNRSDPTFREQAIIAQDNLDFLDELFNNLFDSDDLSSESDAIPDLSILDR
jgi:hypothetical protein